MYAGAAFLACVEVSVCAASTFFTGGSSLPHQATRSSLAPAPIGLPVVATPAAQTATVLHAERQAPLPAKFFPSRARSSAPRPHVSVGCLVMAGSQGTGAAGARGRSGTPRVEAERPTRTSFLAKTVSLSKTLFMRRKHTHTLFFIQNTKFSLRESCPQ